MKIIKILIWIILIIFPITKSFGEATLTHVQTVIFDDESNAKSQNRQIAGIEFNKDGTKLFILTTAFCTGAVVNVIVLAWVSTV